MQAQMSIRGETSVSSSAAKARLEEFLSRAANRVCADCGCPDPKWASINLGVFVCIKCSGVHRSLGVHISKILSVKLDDWTNEQIDALEAMGGNLVLNMKYEALLPENSKKLDPDSPIEERSEYIRKKYKHSNQSDTFQSDDTTGFSLEKKQNERQLSHRRHHGFGHSFRNSWRRSESKAPKKNTSIGMVEFVGLIKVTVVRGTNLAIRDVVSSDPYVILSMGHQVVFDKDNFSSDDRMGEANIDIQPLVSAAKAYENATINEPMQLGKWLASEDNTLVKDSVFSFVDGRVKQDITLRLQNVERGELEIELECVPLSQ